MALRASRAKALQHASSSPVFARRAFGDNNCRIVADGELVAPHRDHVIQMELSNPKGRPRAATAKDLMGSRTRVTARALLVGDRLDTVGLERSDVLSASPLSFRVGEGGVATLF